MAWPDNTIMLWNGTKVSDHNRSPLTVSNERIGTQKRMANGTMRAHFVADKRTFSCSWENLPSAQVAAQPAGQPQPLNTVDLGMSGSAMEAFYVANDGVPFTLTLRTGTGATETVTVMFTEFSKDVVKRGPLVDLWNVTVGMVEV